MRAVVFLAAFVLAALASPGQDYGHLSSIREQQAEGLAEQDINMEDDEHLHRLNYLASRPLNLNQAEKEDLMGLGLSDLQISHFLNYRALFGRLLSIYELQAIPSWDLITIHKLLPYIEVKHGDDIIGETRQQWRGGEHNLSFRTSRVLEKAKGFDRRDSAGSPYLGGPGRWMIRYQYNYKNGLRWGILGDKDAGEPFLKGKQRDGFDFYSFHFFLRRQGLVKSVAIGDFRINMGQGLIQWQSLAMNKSAEVMAVKRQSPVLGAYHAAGEHLFYRGIGITLQKRKWEGTGFISWRRVSANVEPSNGDDHVTSFHTSGYHRTFPELADRNNLRQFTAGGSLSHSGNSGRVALNAVHTLLSMPIRKPAEPYNLFSPKGRSFINASVDYSYTHRNLHVFGEAAVDRGLHKAFLNGVLVSLDPRVDASLVLRVIDRDYQALYSGAFTENTAASNETGWYAGISIRPSTAVTISTYADLYHFPWLRYRVDAPSSGKKYLVQLTYKPNKGVEVYSRFRTGLTEENGSGNLHPTSVVDRVKRQDWRVHASVRVSPDVTVRSRCELSWFNKKQPSAEEGFLIFTDGVFKPRLRAWSAVARLLYFESNGYNARIYAYENDSPGSFSIPPFFDKGYRYYLNLHSAPRKFLVKGVQMECWFRWAQTVYAEKKEFGSGLDLIKGGKKTEVGMEVIFRF